MAKRRAATKKTCPSGTSARKGYTRASRLGKVYTVKSYCARPRSARRAAAPAKRSANPWIRYLKKHSGEGMSRAQLVAGYKRSKA